MPHHLNSVELAEHRLTVAMFLDMEKQADQWLDRDRLERDYNVKLTERLFASITGEMGGRGWAETWVEVEEGEEKSAAFLKTEKHAKVLRRILDNLDAKTFEVDWQTKRIATDALSDDADNLIPCPNGWMICQLERANPQPAQPRPPRAATGAAPAGSTYTAARDINNFYGPATQNHHAPSGENWWAKWGTIAGIVGVLLAGAIWYFSDDFPWKAKPQEPARIEQPVTKR